MVVVAGVEEGDERAEVVKEERRKIEEKWSES